MSSDETARPEGVLATTGFYSYDMEPPGNQGAIPVFAPMRDFRFPPPPRPRYTPPPLADGHAWVELDDDYYLGPGWNDWAGDEHEYPARVFDVTAEQHARWRAAMDAYSAMQEEIGALRSERARQQGVPNGWERKGKPYQVQP